MRGLILTGEKEGKGVGEEENARRLVMWQMTVEMYAVGCLMMSLVGSSGCPVRGRCMSLWPL